MTAYDERLAAFMRDVEKMAQQLAAFTDVVPAVPRDLDDVAAWMDRIARDVLRLAPPAPATPRPVEAPRTSGVRKPSPDTPDDRLRVLEARLAAFQAARRKGGRRSRENLRRARATLTKDMDAAVDKLKKQEKNASLKDAARYVYRTTRSEDWAVLTPLERERAAANLVKQYHREKAHSKKS